jgi:hypothetical protein
LSGKVPTWPSTTYGSQRVRRQRFPGQTAFLDAGDEIRHVLDVLSIVALKTLSNYTNHLAKTPLDRTFEPQRWSKQG